MSCIPFSLKDMNVKAVSASARMNAKINTAIHC